MTVSKVSPGNAKAAKLNVKSAPAKARVEAAAEAKLLADAAHEAAIARTGSPVDAAEGAGGNAALILGGIAVLGGLAAAAAGGGGGDDITVTPAPVTVTPAPTPPPATYALAAGGTSVNEGSSAVFTLTTTNVTAGSPVAYTISGVAADDVVGGKLTGNATVGADGKAVIEVQLVADKLTEGKETVTVTAGGKTASVDVADTSLTPSVFALGNGVDNLPGTAGNDTFNANDVAQPDINGTMRITNALGGADIIDGGAGEDVLNVVTVNPVPNSTTTIVKNVETANFTSQSNVFVDVSTWTGLNTANVLSAGATTQVTAASTTDVNVSGVLAGQANEVEGGKNVSISALAGSVVSVGAGTTGALVGTAAAGAVTVTHAGQGAALIGINGGTTVDVTAAGVTTGQVKIAQGNGATAPTGAVHVTSTGAAYVAGTAAVRGAVTVTGGSTVTVTETATSSTAKAADDVAAAIITQGAANINAAGLTTSVTVNQDAAVAAVNYRAAVAKVDEVQTVTFGVLAAGEKVTIGGLTYTAAVNNTAAQVAAAFANLATGAIAGANGPALGAYTGSWTAEHSSGAAANTGTAAAPVYKVTFTGSGAAVDLTVATADVTGLLPAVDNATFATAATQGTDAVTARAGVMGVAGGAVAIADAGNAAGTDALATVSLKGFGALSTVASDALTSLTLKSSNEDLTVTNAVATTLALSLDGIGISTNTGVLGLGNTYTTLNITTGGAASYADITAGGVTALTVSGDKAIDFGASNFGALKTVTVSGSAGVTGTFSGNTVTAVSTEATTGNSTVTVNAVNATFTGGTGADKVTLSAAAPAKAVSLGGGDDSLTLANGTISATAVLDGGAGTDTLTMRGGDAATVSANALFAAQITGFEKLSLTTLSAGSTVDLANLDAIAHVTLGGVTNTVFTLNNVAAGSTVVLTDQNSVVGTDVDVNLAVATGTADALNLVTEVSLNDLDFGAVDLTGIETVALTATDTSTTLAINKATISLVDANLTTVTVTGNSHLDLTVGAAATKVDGSAMTGGLTAATTAASATILGGAVADKLTAGGNNSVVNGGAGNDTLIITGNLSTLTGGAGSDVFNVADATTNFNTYATITDLSSGDKIELDLNLTRFASAKVTLAATASFADYVNAANVAGGTDGAAWFQYGGDTYVVENVGGADASFTNGTDLIVKASGLLDLSTASINLTTNQLVIA